MFKSLFKTEFAKNILSLSSFSIIAQVINFFLTMVLTRIYIPSDFGLLTIFISYTSFIGVFSTCKYDVALVVAKTREQAISLLRLSFFTTLLFSILIFIVLVLFKPLVIGRLEHPEIMSWLYVMPLFLFLSSATQIFWMWNVREKKFKDISVLRVLETTSNGGFSIILKSFGAIGLLI